jgi:hypothetical protein
MSSQAQQLQQTMAFFRGGGGAPPVVAATQPPSVRDEKTGPLVVDESEFARF